MLYLQTKKPLYQQISQKSKKLVAVLAISTSIIEKTEEKKLKQVSYIWYPVIFKD